LSTVFADTPVKAALKGSGKPDKCSRFFSESQEKPRKLQQLKKKKKKLFEELTHLKREMNLFLLNV
jgi:hypothetical protein